MIRANDLIALFRQALDEKWGYIWGGAGQTWTQAKQSAATRAMTVKHGSKWIGRRVADCSGLFAWAFRQLGGSIYHGSNTIWKKYCSTQGKLVNGARTDGLPLRPGTAVFLTDASGCRHHIGLYVGGDTVIEAKGTAYGVVTSKLNHWDEWGELKAVLYEGDDLMENPTLARGAKGAAVVRLQEALLAQGYALPKYGADGDFGAETEAAVRAAQRDAGFPVTGVCDAQTWGFLTEQDGENGDSAVVQQPSAPTGEEDTARIPKALYDALSAFFKGV